MADFFLAALFPSLADGRFLSMRPVDLVGYTLSMRVPEPLTLKSPDERISKDIDGPEVSDIRAGK